MPENNNKDLEVLLKTELTRETERHLSRLEGLEERVVADLAERVLGRQTRNWLLWRLRRPVLALATATAVFIVGFFLGAKLKQDQAGPPLVVSPGEVLFLVPPLNADSVAILGDFNNWRPTPMQRQSNGLWAIRLKLGPGRYEYGFQIDGRWWGQDPRAHEYVRSYDTYNSVIYVRGDKT